MAGFIGVPQMNFFDAKLIEENGAYKVIVDGVEVELPEKKQQRLRNNQVKSQDITLGVRPDHISLAQEGEDAVVGTVEVSEMMGSAVHLHAKVGDKEAIIIVPTVDIKEGLNIEPGSKIPFRFPGKLVHLFSNETEENLAY